MKLGDRTADFLEVGEIFPQRIFVATAQTVQARVRFGVGQKVHLLGEAKLPYSRMRVLTVSRKFVVGQATSHSYWITRVHAVPIGCGSLEGIKLKQGALAPSPMLTTGLEKAVDL
jgi:hypothetical protein